MKEVVVGTRGRLISLIAALAMLVSACQFDFNASVGGSDTFDPDHLGGEIAADLSAQLGGEFTVVCPADQPIAEGTTFECEATDELGRTGVIAVVASDDDGNVDWELVEVRPSPGEALAPPPLGDAPAVDPSLERPADVPADWVLFAEPGAGFLLWHPPGWIVERDEGTAVFSGPEGTDAYRTTINVQVVTTTAAGGIYPDEDALYADLYEQIVSVDGEVFWEEEDVLELASGPRRALGMQGIWEMRGEQFMQLAIVLARDARTLVQISYTAPIEFYEDSLELAITVVESFDVVETAD